MHFLFNRINFKIWKSLHRALHIGCSSNDKLHKNIWKRYRNLPIPACKAQVTYVWIDGLGENVRSKTRTLDYIPVAPSECPKWDFDGSSAQLSTVKDSDVMLCPVAVYPDPITQGNNKVVLCETYTFDGKPTKTNHRHECTESLNKVCNLEPMFGLEQEYFLMGSNRRPFGWPINGNPDPIGRYYCGVGADKVYGREIIESHYRCCLYCGIDIAGTNAEVTPSQWEFQTGPTIGIKAADDLWMARYLLWRVSEDYGVSISLHPKIFPHWSGSGCHINISTKDMRDEGGYRAIESAIRKLEKKHKEHIRVYDPKGGEDNKLRLTGKHETSSIDKFTFGVGNRGASIRINKNVHAAQKGYLEDRRPSSNVDPYLAIDMIIRTLFLNT